ncbi:5-(carboxyamino)imidazole ribonucleotide mutase [Streptococcus moroccensis]|uniref:N5-carboxyaminoimidazole ribonucleotide mutase n=1 Tax=Streptococcus moroccensis TaxID=1451356 RepID=A0ABT9YQC5_9STRE|nr:5-(carboxyamino)imidazole ribonucleotide mutase [Streptococcus moroccensis]MDQ0222092.1 5-(carboxyamino)imidazole ribonucleotide mutase [Streptococcus moroccensis]
MNPIISIIMGSSSDWSTMQKAAQVLDDFGVPYEKKVVSAHRTPDLMFQHAEEARGRGIKVIIAGAGGAAHLPGMVAAKTTLPVIGVPVKSRALSGLDSLYSIVQMPGGVPVATMAIGEAGGTNAALTALRILSIEDAQIAQQLAEFAVQQGKIAEAMTDDLN